MNNNVNMIWEEKGIILGIILFLLKNRENLFDKKIIILNDYVRKIIKELFLDLIIKKRGKGFNINIKNNENSGLIINNLNNLNKINSKSVRLLPWYDSDNPIVMFKYNKNNDYDLEKFRNKLKKFDKEERWLIYDRLNFIERKLGLRNWDTYMEYRILERYTKKYNSFNVYHLYLFLCNKLKRSDCEEQKIIGYPVVYQQKVPIPVKVKEKCSCDNYVDLINGLNNKFKLVNEMLKK